MANVDEVIKDLPTDAIDGGRTLLKKGDKRWH